MNNTAFDIIIYVFKSELVQIFFSETRVYNNFKTTIRYCKVVLVLLYK